MKRPKQGRSLAKFLPVHLDMYGRSDVMDREAGGAAASTASYRNSQRRGTSPLKRVRLKRLSW